MKRFLLITAILSCTSSSYSSPIELNFDNIGIQTPSFENFDYAGFRFSPSCHVDNNPSNPTTYPGTSGSYLGSDVSGCLDSPIYLGNANYLGPMPIIDRVNIYIETISGQAWSLQSLTLHGEIINIHSSRGGIRNLNYITDTPVQMFSGSEWTNIDWLVISGGGGTPQGFDNLVVSIPEPSSLLLSLAAISSLFALTKRSR